MNIDELSQLLESISDRLGREELDADARKILKENLEDLYVYREEMDVDLDLENLS